LTALKFTLVYFENSFIYSVATRPLHFRTGIPCMFQPNLIKLKCSQVKSRAPHNERRKRQRTGTQNKKKTGKGNGATEYGMRKYSYCKDRTDVREFVWL